MIDPGVGLARIVFEIVELVHGEGIGDEVVLASPYHTLRIESELVAVKLGEDGVPTGSVCPVQPGRGTVTVVPRAGRSPLPPGKLASNQAARRSRFSWDRRRGCHAGRLVIIPRVDRLLQLDIVRINSERTLIVVEVLRISALGTVGAKNLWTLIATDVPLPDRAHIVSGIRNQSTERGESSSRIAFAS